MDPHSIFPCTEQQMYADPTLGAARVASLEFDYGVWWHWRRVSHEHPKRVTLIADTRELITYEGVTGNVDLLAICTAPAGMPADEINRLFEDITGCMWPDWCLDGTLHDLTVCLFATPHFRPARTEVTS